MCQVPGTGYDLRCTKVLQLQATDKKYTWHSAQEIEGKNTNPPIPCTTKPSVYIET